jgi:hypothetical protein
VELGPCTASALNANAIPPLVRHLSSSDIKVQEAAAGALWNITFHDPAQAVAVDENAIPGLVRLLSSNDNAVIIAACAALRNITWNLDRARASALNAKCDSSTRSSSLFQRHQSAGGGRRSFVEHHIHEPAQAVAVDENAIPGLVRLLSSTKMLS